MDDFLIKKIREKPFIQFLCNNVHYNFFLPTWWNEIEVNESEIESLKDSEIDNYCKINYGADVGTKTTWKLALKAHAIYDLKQNRFPIYIGHCASAGGESDLAVKVYTELFQLVPLLNYQIEWFHTLLAYQSANEYEIVGQIQLAIVWYKKAIKYLNSETCDKAIKYYANISQERIDKLEIDGNHIKAISKSEFSENEESEDPLMNIFDKTGDLSQVSKFIDENPNIIKSMLEDIAFADEPAEKYRIQAVNKLYKEKDNNGAVQLINKGLEYNDPRIEPFLYELRSDCARELSSYKEALNYMDLAVQSIFKNPQDRFYSIYELLAKRGRLKLKLGDELGAKQDENKASEYYEKHNATKVDGEDNDLPF